MKMWSFYFFVIFCLILTNGYRLPTCPPDTIRSQYDNKTCYLFVKEPKNFTDAENFCNVQEGNLAAVFDIFVNQFLSGKLYFFQAVKMNGS